MGGTINVAIRFRSGETVCVDRWTNEMPYWFKDPRMFEGDETYVREYLGKTRNVDYVLERHAHGRPQPLRNSEYGLIVWDYVTNTIFDNNMYSSPIEMSEIDAVGALRPEMRDIFTAHARRGTVNLVRTGYVIRRQVLEEVIKLTYEEALAKAVEMDANRSFSRGGISEDLNVDGMKIWESFVLDPHPMTYVDLSQDGNIRHKLKEIGFPMTKAQGLNRTVAVPPPFREISSIEHKAREIFLHWKLHSDNVPDGAIDGKSYDGVSFEKIPKKLRAQFMKEAENITDTKINCIRDNLYG